MKIAIDISQAQYRGTGVGNYTYNLVSHLLQLDNKNHYLLFGGSFRGYFNLKTLANTLSGAQNKIYPLPPTLSDIIFNKLHTIPIETFTGNIDIFHASDWTQPPTKLAKSITTIHDLTVLKFPQHHHPKTIAAHQRRLEHVKNEADQIIADSLVTKQDIIDLLKIPEEKIHVVHLAANPNITEFSKLPQQEKNNQTSFVKEKYNLPDKYILSVGTSEPRKNLTRTIKAHLFSKLDLPLVIVGKFGWGLAPELKAETTNVLSLGFVPDEDLAAVFSEASCFVYPSLYEGFGLPVLEAMTLGVPVVTTNRGSLKEVAGQAAVLVNPEKVENIAAGIKKALNSPKSYSQKGNKQAKKFSWEKTAEKTLAVYEKAFTQSN